MIGGELEEKGAEADRAFRVEGRVQGVGFRMWTRDLARGLGLRGWVRNQADGSVEVHAAGDVERVEELRERLHRGPPAARIRSVSETGSASSLPKEGFEIRM